MQISSFLPDDQVLWYLTKRSVEQLNRPATADVVVIGGGMAGLSAAQSFLKKGCKVILLEKTFCGGGATGKSSGFITPSSELSLQNLIHKLGLTEAHKLWNFILSGMELIEQNIHTHQIECDYQQQDTLVIAHTQKAFDRDIDTEYKGREQLGYTSKRYTAEALPSILGSTAYYGGISYGPSFNIRGYPYCQQLKEILKQQGAQIYEETPAIDITDRRVTTPRAHVEAEHIVVCTDYTASSLPTLADKLYHVQTVLMASAPLSEAQVKQLFPHKRYMAWDTDLVYQYFRLTGDDRLLLGGATIADSYASEAKYHNHRGVKKLSTYWKKHFPQLPVQFEYVWPGMIGVSKDLLPLAGTDPQMPSVYYVTAATGLAWAAALGAYSAEHLIDKRTDLDALFALNRKFPIGGLAQQILGTKLTFALSHFLTASSI